MNTPSDAAPEQARQTEQTEQTEQGTQAEQGAQAEQAERAGGDHEAPPASSAPALPTPSTPILPTQSREDTDVGWGDYGERDDNDRLLRDRPPHWDSA